MVSRRKSLKKYKKKSVRKSVRKFVRKSIKKSVKKVKSRSKRNYRKKSISKIMKRLNINDGVKLKWSKEQLEELIKINNKYGGFKFNNEPFHKAIKESPLLKDLEVKQIRDKIAEIIFEEGYSKLDRKENKDEYDNFLKFVNDKISKKEKGEKSNYSEIVDEYNEILKRKELKVRVTYNQVRNIAHSTSEIKKRERESKEEEKERKRKRKKEECKEEKKCLKKMEEEEEDEEEEDIKKELIDKEKKEYDEEALKSIEKLFSEEEELDFDEEFKKLIEPIVIPTKDEAIAITSILQQKGKSSDEVEALLQEYLSKKEKSSPVKIVKRKK